MNLEINPSKIFAIAKKEYMDNVRNKWMLTLTIIFIILTLVISYFTVSAVPTSVAEIVPLGEWDPVNNYLELGDNGEGGDSYDAYMVNSTGNFTFDGQAYEFQYNESLPSDWVVNIDDHWQIFRFVNFWNASANIPELLDNGVNGEPGDFYIVMSAGNHTLDGNTSWVENDILVNYGGQWVKLTTPDGEVGFKGFESTVLGMISITSMILPILAIMLGYGTIIGEQENGSMSVVLGCPVSRYDVIIGKFSGLGAVMFTTIFAGMGLSGAVIALTASSENLLEYILFILGTWVFSMVFLGMSIFMSTIAKKKSTALGGGVFLWFSGMIIGIIVFGIWAATGGDFEALLAGDMSFPDWIWAVEYFSFMDVYQMGSMLLFGMTQFMGFTMDAPSWVTAASTFGWLTFIAALSFILSMEFFQNKDL